MITGHITSYGSPQSEKVDGLPGVFQRERRNVNYISVASSLLIPTLIFMTVFGILSFHIHFSRPGLCWFLVIVALLAVAVFWGVAWQTLARRKMEAAERKKPSWIILLAGTSLIAWILAFVLGTWNYGSVMLPHYKLVTLNTYANVDPGQISGSGVMDAGRLSFKAGTFIDTSKAIGFKKVDTYCIAPVTSTHTPLLTYDFWAAGVNCCSGAPGDFHCGEVDGKLQLGGGDRVLSDSQIPWLTLATQQAEAFHHIKVGHAIFFKNTQDPLGEESAQLDRGVKFFCFCSLIFFGVQGFLVSLTLVDNLK